MMSNEFEETCRKETQREGCIQVPSYVPHSRDRCPYCHTVVKFEPPNITQPTINLGHVTYSAYQAQSPNEKIDIAVSFCSNCLDLIISKLEPEGPRTIWPLTGGRPPAHSDVPENIAEDYNEAVLVFPFSAKASAALSRRCLQSVLSDPNAGNSKQRNLSKQIEEVLKTLPSYISNNLDYVREIGNFATHEQKSVNTGEIIDVEPGEAELNLDVLEDLFDFYYIKPKSVQKRRNEFDKKIQEAGRKSIAVETEEEHVQEESEG